MDIDFNNFDDIEVDKEGLTKKSPNYFYTYYNLCYYNKFLLSNKRRL